MSDIKDYKHLVTPINGDPCQLVLVGKSVKDQFTSAERFFDEYLGKLSYINHLHVTCLMLDARMNKSQLPQEIKRKIRQFGDIISKRGRGYNVSIRFDKNLDASKQDKYLVLVCSSNSYRR